MKNTRTPSALRWNTVATAVTLATTLVNGAAAMNSALPADLAPPIQLISFTATQDHEHVRLDWATASEWNNIKFILERSTDGVNFQSFSIVPGAGNSNELLTYKWLDRTPPHGLVHYRLQQIDDDGHSSYSPVASIDMGTPPPGPVVSPNPIAADQFTLNGDVIGNQLEIRTLNGSLIRSLIATSNTVKYGDLEPGTYLLRIIDPKTGSVRITRFVRQ